MADDKLSDEKTKVDLARQLKRRKMFNKFLR